MGSAKVFVTDLGDIVINWNEGMTDSSYLLTCWFG